MRRLPITREICCFSLCFNFQIRLSRSWFCLWKRDFVSIHNLSFLSGSFLLSVGFTDHYRGDALTTFHDVVYVAIGYRVGLAGMRISLHHYHFIVHVQYITLTIDCRRQWGYLLFWPTFNNFATQPANFVILLFGGLCHKFNSVGNLALL